MTILHSICHFINQQYEKVIGAIVPAWAIAEAQLSVQQEFALKTLWYLIVAPISVLLCTITKKVVEHKWEQWKEKRKNK